MSLIDCISCFFRLRLKRGDVKMPDMPQLVTTHGSPNSQGSVANLGPEAPGHGMLSKSALSH